MYIYIFAQLTLKKSFKKTIIYTYQIKDKLATKMSSTLDSFDGTTHLLPDLIKLVQDVKDATENAENMKFAKLGQKYLSAIVTEILLFRVKTPVKDTNLFIDANMSETISDKFFKGESSTKLDIALGRMYYEKDAEKIRKVQEDIQTFFEVQFANEESYSKFVFEVSVSSINKKKNNFLDESSFPTFDEIHSFDSKEKSFDRRWGPQDQQKHMKEVEDYLKGKNGTSEINLLEQHRQKSIKIENEVAPVGGLTRHTITLKFVNFLDDGQAVKLTVTGEGHNKNVARQQASRLMLTRFFNEFPYIFKDYVHVQKSKGK